MRTARKRLFTSILLLSLCVCQTESARAQEYLSAREVAAIGLGSVGLAFLGERAVSIDSTRPALIRGPLPLEVPLQSLLGGKYYNGKTNFLDNGLGSILTPAVMGAMLFTADAFWPPGGRTKIIAQDLFLYSSGLLATQGLTELTKSMVARKRPFAYLYPDLAARRPDNDHEYDRQSFFSGHASSSFFAAAFVNIRLRSIMRGELSPEKYRDWRWAPPVLLYGWAGFVGWSRIHAYKHYISDILAGALAGYLMAELFYSFADEFEPGDTEGSSAAMFTLTFRF